MRQALIIVVLLAVALSIQASPADSAVNRDSRYVFSVRSGMAFCNTCELDGPATGYFTTVHGIRLTPGMRLGLGVGVTSVAETMIVPLFGSFKLNLFGKKNKVFAEANYGFARSLHGSVSEASWTEKTVAKSYLQPSIGYSIAYHDIRMGITLGLQSLRMVSTVTYTNDNWWPRGIDKQATPSTSEFKYNVTRVVVGLSIGWGD